MPKYFYGELFKRHENNPIITAADIPYRANAVFNAAAIKHNDEHLLLLRVEDFKGHSHLTLARSANGLTDWKIEDKPFMEPDSANFPEDTWGIEDPRITFIEELNKYAILFVSFSKNGPLISLALTEDFKTYERLGAITDPDDKDMALFPVKINGRWAMIRRPYNLSDGEYAHIYISYSDDLKVWDERRVLIKARDGGWWDARKIGLNTPPLLTEHGWLAIYHGVRHTCAGCIYRLGLVLLDRDNPEKVLRRSDEWIFGPREDYELLGDVGNVVFPCGWILEGDEIRMYYGAADTSICVATAKLDDVMDYILNCPPG